MGEQSLRRVHEHQMVRHESAEALGAIDGNWERVETILKEFLNDHNQVVRESCIVALDAADYWGHSNNIDDDNYTNHEENHQQEQEKGQQRHDQQSNHHQSSSLASFGHQK